MRQEQRRGKKSGMFHGSIDNVGKMPNDFSKRVDTPPRWQRARKAEARLLSSSVPFMTNPSQGYAYCFATYLFCYQPHEREYHSQLLQIMIIKIAQKYPKNYLCIIRQDQSMTDLIAFDLRNPEELISKLDMRA
ncbi:hypothetical protein CEXT_372721 [Caerostris extrusa]|uniref:Uncharacterized protein n=1 Tax=Caerostris extrusa TaxID=172846 RepID=A0AAV4MMV1_CAEEX|nr:hypothetical protein CEXT_372721 [Caerostris extrusa]